MPGSLFVGVAVAVGALAYVVMPLFRGRPVDRAVPPGVLTEVGREVTDEEIEAAVRSYRECGARAVLCAVCGPRPELDALFCSTCGRRLAS